MTDVVLVRYDIEPGRTAELESWLEGLDDHPIDVEALLRAEGMLTESLFVDRSGATDRLVWYQEAEDIEAAIAAFEAATGDGIEAAKRTLDELLDRGLNGPADVIEPVVHAVNPDR